MPDYSFWISREPGYLHAHIGGMNDVPTTRRYVDDVIRVCRENNCPHVLVEENLEGERLSMGDIYQILTDKIDELRQAVRLSAFVDVSPRRSVSNLKFGETVAVNRNFTVVWFATVEEAAAFLRKAISGTPPA